LNYIRKSIHVPSAERLVPRSYMNNEPACAVCSTEALVGLVRSGRSAAGRSWVTLLGAAGR